MGNKKKTFSYKLLEKLTTKNDIKIAFFFESLLPSLFYKLTTLFDGEMFDQNINNEVAKVKKKKQFFNLANSLMEVHLFQRERNILALVILMGFCTIKRFDSSGRFNCFHFEVPLESLTPSSHQLYKNTLFHSPNFVSSSVKLNPKNCFQKSKLTNQTTNELVVEDSQKKNLLYLPPNVVSIGLNQFDSFTPAFLTFYIEPKIRLKPFLKKNYSFFGYWSRDFLSGFQKLNAKNATSVDREWYEKVLEIPNRLSSETTFQFFNIKQPLDLQLKKKQNLNFCTQSVHCKEKEWVEWPNLNKIDRAQKIDTPLFSFMISGLRLLKKYPTNLSENQHLCFSSFDLVGPQKDYAAIDDKKNQFFCKTVNSKREFINFFQLSKLLVSPETNQVRGSLQTIDFFNIPTNNFSSKPTTYKLTGCPLKEIKGEEALSQVAKIQKEEQVKEDSVKEQVKEGSVKEQVKKSPVKEGSVKEQVKKSPVKEITSLKERKTEKDSKRTNFSFYDYRQEVYANFYRFGDKVKNWYFDSPVLAKSQHQDLLNWNPKERNLTLRQYCFTPRHMSGFQYPEKNTNQLRFFFAKLTYQKKLEASLTWEDKADFLKLKTSIPKKFQLNRNPLFLFRENSQSYINSGLNKKKLGADLPLSLWNFPDYQVNQLNFYTRFLKLYGHTKSLYIGLATDLDDQTKDVDSTKETIFNQETTSIFEQDFPFLGVDRPYILSNLREKLVDQGQSNPSLFFWKGKTRSSFNSLNKRVIQTTDFSGTIGLEQLAKLTTWKRTKKFYKRLKKRPNLPSRQWSIGKRVSVIGRKNLIQTKEKIISALQEQVTNNQIAILKFKDKCEKDSVVWKPKKWPTLNKSLRLFVPQLLQSEKSILPLAIHLNRLDYQDTRLSFFYPRVNTIYETNKKLFQKRNEALFVQNILPLTGQNICSETETDEHGVAGWFDRPFDLSLQGQINNPIRKAVQVLILTLAKRGPKKVDSRYVFQDNNSVIVHHLNIWQPTGCYSLLVLGQAVFWWVVWQYISFLDRAYHQKGLISVMNQLIKLGVLSSQDAERLYFFKPKVSYRIFVDIKSRFKNFIFTDQLLVELSEIVWFLRGRGRATLLSEIPKGILLMGPPGTGKTLLVRSLAGEAEVPVIVKSGSTLYTGNKENQPTEQLQQIFYKAKRMAPCLLFIDEIDSLGVSRGSIYNVIGELVELLLSWDVRLIERHFYQDSLFDDNTILGLKVGLSGNQKEDFVIKELADLFTQIGGQEYHGEIRRGAKLKAFWVKSLINAAARREVRNKNLNLLSQFLVQMDGFVSRKGVVVFGATNRSQVLDPALLRPGRFGRVLSVPLPGRKRRTEILKLYAKRVGIEGIIPWVYLANRVAGWSAADIESAINQSAIRAILNKTLHTLESLEYGVDLVTSSGHYEKISIKDTLFGRRRAYYQAGKAVAFSLLPNHPPAVVFYLWAKSKSVRQTSFANIWQMPLMKTAEGFTPYMIRKDLESRIIGLFSGKAGEALGLINCSNQLQLDTSLFSKKIDLFYKINSIKRCLWKFSIKPLAIPLTQEFSFSTTSFYSSYSQLKKSIITFLVKKKTNRLVNCTKIKSNKKNNSIDPIETFSVENILQVQKLSTIDPKSFSVCNLSNIGAEEVEMASKLGVLMVEKWHLFSGLLLSQNRHSLETKLSDWEYDESDYLSFLEDANQHLNQDIDPSAWEYLKSSFMMKGNDQLRLTVWWSKETIFPLKSALSLPPTWWRFYLPNRTENQLNEQWVQPEQYYQAENKLLNLTKGHFKNETAWNQLYGSNRDYFYHSLLTSGYGRAFLLLQKNRELIDFFAHWLVEHKILREDIINHMIIGFCP